MKFDFSKIKLVIWDLDDTFWEGTISEGSITPINSNIELIKNLTQRGIINSICSKNDIKPVEEKLQELNIMDIFVFKSINWEPKGQRISQLIKNMGLRPSNCLFIDDNIVNLNEASFYEHNLMVMEPYNIPKLIEYFSEIPINDPLQKRLKNYQILEDKFIARQKSNDNLDFLYSSNTQVEIHNNCLCQIERIYELVTRTNQLNYTKRRSTIDELIKICSDCTIQSGYVTVSDKFGEYGIVGFYALKNNQLIHFLFSCRTIGQGVEQYVYAFLNHPQLNVVGEVVNQVTHEPAPAWINNNNNNNNNVNNIKSSSKHKIILKGGCDLKIMVEYLNTASLIEEFTYISSQKKNNIEHGIHSINYLSLPFLSPKEKELLLKECIFNDENIFQTAIYDNDVSLIFLGSMVEPNLGIYRNKSKGFKIAFGEYIYPLTEQKNWDAYINGNIFTADNQFTKEWLEEFSRKYEYIGHLSPEEILENIKLLLSKISPKAKVCYLLGSETPFLKNTQKNYENRHLIYKEINTLIREFSKINDRVLYIDFNDYIRGQEDFTNNINHFQRRVYYEVATKANEYISNLTGEKLQQKSRFYLFYKSFIDKIGNTGFYQTKFYSIIRIPYLFIKSLFK